MVFELINTFLALNLSLTETAQGDRTVKGAKSEPPPTASQYRGFASTIPSSYFGGGNTSDALDFKQDHSTLINRFSSNPKLSGSMKAVDRAIAFFVKNKKGIPKECGGTVEGKPITNHEWIVVTDYTKPNDQHRMFFLNLKSGEVISAPAAHGYGSNKNCPEEHTFQCKDSKGRLKTKCKIPATIGDVNKSGTNSRGFYLSAESYASGEPNFKSGDPKYVKGDHNGIILDGAMSVNENSRKRMTVFHRAGYVSPEKVNLCSNSAGCPSTDPAVFEMMKEKLKNGALFYSHTIEDDKLTAPDC